VNRALLVADQYVPQGIIGKFVVHVEYGTAGKTENIGYSFTLQTFKKYLGPAVFLHVLRLSVRIPVFLQDRLDFIPSRKLEFFYPFLLQLFISRQKMLTLKHFQLLFKQPVLKDVLFQFFISLNVLLDENTVLFLHSRHAPYLAMFSDSL
jgi:hypothetical protein